MELIKRVTLYYQVGNSDKVYEVDLCRITEDGYLVNFRYGRRGKSLKEGTKTPQPITQEQGEKKFAQLVASKKAAGYQEGERVLVSQEEQKEFPEVTDPRHRAILKHLAREDGGTWRLERVIWKAGELRLKEATPYLINLLGKGNDLSDYCIAWSLGRCEGVEGMEALGRMLREPSRSEFVKRMVWEALYKLSDEAGKSQLQQEAIQALPEAFRRVVVNGTAEALGDQLTQYLSSDNPQNFAILETLYQIDNAIARPVLLKWLKESPIEWNYFQRMRHLFKMSEYRQDALVYGILAYRFDKQLPNNPKGSRIFYTRKTREYFRKRVLENLRDFSKENATAYVNLATEILLQYKQEDQWCWDKKIFYTLLHQRYESVYPNRKVVFKFSQPELWKNYPDNLLRLVLEGNYTAVYYIGIQELKNFSNFVEQLDINTTIQALSRPYSEVVNWGLELARSRYNKEQPQVDLIIALVNSILPQVRQQGYRWIEANLEYFVKQSNFVLTLITSPQKETSSFSQKVLKSQQFQEESTQESRQLLIGQIIVFLLSLDSNSLIKAQEIAAILLENFKEPLRRLGFEVIQDLLQHPLSALKALGARILVNHEIPAEELPSELIESLLASPDGEVRQAGIQIFEQLSDRALMNDRLLLIAMAVNANEDLRLAIRPVIQRLGERDGEFALELATDFLDLLAEPERHEGVHQNLVYLLRNRLSGWMSGMMKEEVMPLLQAKSSIAQELGGRILQENIDRYLPEFDTSEIVELGSHEILAVRQAARQMFRRRLDDIYTNKEEMLSAVRFLEAKWEDSQNFALELFRTLPSESWQPEVMIFVCDSVKEEVRQFGRDLVIQHFQQEDGQEYLLKFTEHPSADMQTFATHYLETYGSGNIDRLRQLKPYFITVLSSVNRSRVAKDRLFHFLQNEAKKSKEAAELVAEILTRQSVTIAIKDKAKTIEMMLELRQLYPDINVPLQVKEVVEVRL